MIKHFVSATLAVLALSSLQACSQNAPVATKHDSIATQSMPPYEQLVGRWKFVYSPERRAAVEADLAQKISDPTALAAAKLEAEQEASVSEVEFTKDHQYISWIGGKEHFRAGPNDEPPPGLRIVLRDADTMVMTVPPKGDLVFLRIK
jgi:hypothetical protein